MLSGRLQAKGILISIFTIRERFCFDFLLFCIFAELSEKNGTTELAVLIGSEESLMAI